MIDSLVKVGYGRVAIFTFSAVNKILSKPIERCLEDKSANVLP